MRLSFVKSFFFFALLSVVGVSSPGLGDETTNIAELLQLRDKNPDNSVERLPLNPEWVGDITIDGGKARKLRLEFGGISKGDVILYRIWNDRFTAADAPRYMKTLPQPVDLAALKTVAELEKYFGPSKAFTTGWGDTKRMHWTVGWTYFTKESNKQLRYMSVSVSVSSATDAKRVDIDRLRVSHGSLRQADPNSLAERKEFPTAEALFLAEESRKQKERNAFPQPLRSLLEVADRPDDSDLVHYRNHLNAIRQNPDPKIFEQLVEEMHEGTLLMQGHLEKLLCGLWPPGMPAQPSLPRLAPWKAEERTVAIKVCIDSIPKAKNNRTVAKLAEILLRMNGGGTITVSNWDGTGGEFIKVTHNGFSSDTADRNPTREETQAELLRQLLSK